MGDARIRTRRLEAPVASFRWTLRPVIERIGENEWSGVAMQLEVRSPACPLHWVIEDATWELGGRASGATLIQQDVSAMDLEQTVKRGFLAPPQNKRYSLRQLCRILNINTLRGVLPMERICGMLVYINGALDDESDDTIDDSVLYFMFVRLAAQARAIERTEGWDQAIQDVLRDYQEPIPGAKERIAKVLRVMVLGYAASRMKQEAETLMETF